MRVVQRNTAGDRGNDGFYVERLMHFLNALGRDIEIVIRKKPRFDGPGSRRSAHGAGLSPLDYLPDGLYHFVYANFQQDDNPAAALLGLDDKHAGADIFRPDGREPRRAP